MTWPEGEGKEVGLWRYNDLDSNPGSAICWKDTFKLINLSDSQFPYVQIGQNMTWRFVEIRDDIYKVHGRHPINDCRFHHHHLNI